MSVITAADGTRLSYHVTGSGADPVVCLPGGPMRDSGYLADLGGLARRLPLARLDLRGTGDSAAPEDPASFRCDRQVDDVEALRVALGLDRMRLLTHSAGANLAVRYLERHPDRVSRLVLVTPSVRAVDLDFDDELHTEVARLRAGEPWFPDAFAAWERIVAETETEADWDAIAPFGHGRWDEAARAREAAVAEQRNADAARLFNAEGAYDPAATRAALARFAAPVLVLAGGFDLHFPPAALADFAALFGDARLVTQAGAGHYPWFDDPAAFVATVAGFLS